MNILVTGGAGFIGSHVVDAVLAAGHSVAVVDNLSTGRIENVNPPARLHQVDIRDEDSVTSVMVAEKPEIVIHHAAQVDVRKSVSDPLYDAGLNILGSISLLEACRKYGVRKIIYASSGGAIYGEPSYLPCDEAHPVLPLSQYGASKYTAELYLRAYAGQYGLEYTILRYANVYGPRQVPFGEAGVVAVFTYRMLRGQEPAIFGSGEQQRDFIYAGDVARANVASLSAGNGRAYNIGLGRGVSINQLFADLKSQVGYEGNAVYLPAKPGETFRIWLDASLAQRELLWSPRVELRSGLALTVDALRSNLDRIGV